LPDGGTDGNLVVSEGVGSSVNARDDGTTGDVDLIPITTPEMVHAPPPSGLAICTAAHGANATVFTFNIPLNVSWKPEWLGDNGTTLSKHLWDDCGRIDFNMIKVGNDTLFDKTFPWHVQVTTPPFEARKEYVAKSVVEATGKYVMCDEFEGGAAIF